MAVYAISITSSELLRAWLGLGGILRISAFAVSLAPTLLRSAELLKLRWKANVYRLRSGSAFHTNLQLA